MRAGLLRDRISIQEAAITQNSTTGEVIQTWSTYADEHPANVELKGSAEVYLDDQRYAKTDATIRMRFVEGVTTKMRVA